MPGHRREVTTPSCELVIAAQKASWKQLAWSSLAQNHVPQELQFCWQNLWAQRGAELGFSWVNVHVKHQNGGRMCIVLVPDGPMWVFLKLLEFSSTTVRSHLADKRSERLQELRRWWWWWREGVGNGFLAPFGFHKLLSPDGYFQFDNTPGHTSQRVSRQWSRFQWPLQSLQLNLFHVAGWEMSQIRSNGVRSGVCWGHLSTANFLSCWRSQLKMMPSLDGYTVAMKWHG